MRLQSATGWRSLLFTITLLYTNALAKKEAPGVSVTEFKFIPWDVQYFDDSDTMLFEDRIGRVVYRSEDAGESWKPVDTVPQGELLELSMHPFDNKRAYIVGGDKTHWLTKDRGKSWTEFQTDSPASLFREALTYHAADPDRIIFNAMDCTGIFCEEVTMYTTNGFSKTPKFLRSDTDGCHWAKSSELFTTGQKDLDDNRIICVVRGRFSPWRKDYRLLISDNYFASVGSDTQEFEPELEPGRTVQGIVNMAVVKKFLVVAATAEGTDEMALYVSDDAIKWHRAVFPHDHKLTEKAYTVLESTNYSIQIDVLNSRPGNPMGVFLSSNSNGTYFTRNIEHTNRNYEGFVDFEKVSGIQGIVLVNAVDNWEKVQNSGSGKVIKSQISFDDGRTFQALKCDGDDLHLHSVTDLSNVGRVFSSPAPGLVMGVGNTGDSLDTYEKGNLYVSDDAGETWRLGIKGPHKYEFGDQGSILVAIEDTEDGTDEFKYSINHGKKWHKADIGQKIRPLQLTTTKDSTSLKFLLEGIEPHKVDNPTSYIISLDFDDMHESKCKDSDMEEWFARADSDGKGTCLMGHKQSYMRRKADADCFIKKEFVDPVPMSTPCDCTDADFECDVNYVRSADRKECVYAEGLSMFVPPGECKNPDDTFEASSGWRIIPGNDCKRSSGAQKDDKVKTKCSDAGGPPPASGNIANTQNTLPGSGFMNKVYLERTGVSSGLTDGQHDETVLMRTDVGVFLSHNHGKTWEQILKDEKIYQIYPHTYFNDVVFFITDTEKVFYSVDRGVNIRSFQAKYPPNLDGIPVMSFHQKNKDWIIWIGAKDCDSAEGCHSVATLTMDRGDDGWKTIRRYVGKCEFIKEPERKLNKEEQEKREKLIYCESREREELSPGNPMQLVSSTNFFDGEPEVHLTNVVDFATMSEFIVVATRDEEHKSLKASASVNGEQFAEANFPHGFVVDHQEGYTVLDSSTHSVFLHVTTNNDKGNEYGTIIKSNSNGTNYVLSLNAVDRDTTGYVDFEKMFGIEGVAMVNVVANYDSKNYKTEGKKLKSMITHNDGAEWDYLPPPAKDAEGKNFDCSGKMEKCSLNIHGYTERKDKSHTFYSASAIGLMMGTGNVGEYLGDLEKSDTFMTADGGITWKSVKKGKFMWEFGDQGSIVVIVKDDQSTNMVHYSLDEGDTWLDYQFSDKEIRIQDITTVPSDNARNFLLWGKDDGKLVTINLDFTGLTDVPCKLDENDVEAGDYYLWQPKHPKQDDDCLFGHVSQYHRKKINSKCYNGRMIPHLHDIAKNCSCTRQDFECDFNFERQNDGSCKLIAGYSPPDHSLICKEDADLEEWYETTGFRRIPITTCQGGKELDVSIAHPCPGWEDKFGKKHGPSGWGIFFAIIIPIAVASGVGYWVWKNWANKFGQIRLGEQSSFDGEAPYVKYPVMVIAGLITVVNALPLLASSLWRSASNAVNRSRGTRFTTRDSFARGRGDYAIVDEDEGELLGDESDEEV